jgi:hypothetical protein
MSLSVLLLVLVLLVTRAVTKSQNGQVKSSQVTQLGKSSQVQVMPIGGQVKSSITHPQVKSSLCTKSLLLNFKSLLHKIQPQCC